MALKKNEKRHDRLRNRFFRWIGVTPNDDFEYNADDVMRVLEAFEKFSKHSAMFSSVVAQKLDIKFDGYKDISKKVNMEDEQGMYG